MNVFLFRLGSSLLSLCFGVFATTSLFFHLATWFGLPVPGAAARLGGSLVAFFFLSFGVRPSGLKTKLRRSEAWRLFVGAILLAIAITLLSSAFVDFSYDGQNFQQTAVLELAKGWNPYLDPTPVTPVSWRLSNYPKFSWIFAETIYSVTGSLDASKSVGLILWLASFLVTYSVLQKRPATRGFFAFALAFTLAASPIVLSQAFTFCVDGHVASLILLACVFSYASFDVDRSRAREARLGSALTLAILINAKSTGLVHAVVIYFSVLGLALIAKRAQAARAWWLPNTLALLLGFVVLGYSPYVRTFEKSGTALLPLEVNLTDADPFAHHRPLGFERRGRASRFFLSTFTTGQAGPKATAELKVPFTLSPDEFRFAADEFCRLGGLGPLFGGALLLSLALLIPALRRRAVWIAGAVPMLIALASCFANPEMWWHRFVPQLWIVPFIPLWAIRSEKATNVRKNLGMATLSVLFLDCLGVGFAVGEKQSEERRALAALIKETRRPERIVAMAPNVWPSITLRLRENGIRVAFLEESRWDEGCEGVGNFLKPDYPRLCMTKEEPLARAREIGTSVPELKN